MHAFGDYISEDFRESQFFSTYTPVYIDECTHRGGEGGRPPPALLSLSQSPLCHGPNGPGRRGRSKAKEATVRRMQTPAVRREGRETCPRAKGKARTRHHGRVASRAASRAVAPRPLFRPALHSRDTHHHPLSSTWELTRAVGPRPTGRRSRSRGRAIRQPRRPIRPTIVKTHPLFPHWENDTIIPKFRG